MDTLNISNAHCNINYSSEELNFLSEFLTKYLNGKKDEEYAKYKAERDFYNSPGETAKRLVKTLSPEQKVALKELLDNE